MSASSGDWECSACTFLNRQSTPMCAVCMTPRRSLGSGSSLPTAPSLPRPGGAAPSGSADTGAPPPQWLVGLHRALHAQAAPAGVGSNPRDALVSASAPSAASEPRATATPGGSSAGAPGASSGADGRMQRWGGRDTGVRDATSPLADRGGARGTGAPAPGPPGGADAGAAATGAAANPGGAPPLGAAAAGAIPADVRTLLMASKGFLPFLLLLLMLFLHQHFIGIAAFLVMSACLSQVQQRFREQVALKENHAKSMFAVVIGLCALNSSFMLAFFRDDELWHYLVFAPPRRDAAMAGGPISLWEALWWVCAGDLIVRFCIVGLKAMCGIAPFSCSCRRLQSPHAVQRRKRHLYAVIELLGAVARAAFSTPVWMRFYMSQTHSEVVASGLAGAYMVLKGVAVVGRLRSLLKQGSQFIRQSTPFGRPARAAEIAEAGSPDCSICQDPLTDAVALPCNHMYCEDCIAEWLEREQTCPICRARVPYSGQLSGAETSNQLMVALF